MGKDLNKKFTVSLDISTKDAEKQVAASAENIKQILSNAIKDGVGVKELRNIAKSVNSIFEGIGQEAPIDIDKSFTGNGSVAKRVKVLTDALDGLSDVMDKIKSGSYDIPGGEKFDGLNKEVQEEIDKLKKQQQEIQEIVNSINNPQNVKVKLAKKSDDQIEQLKALKKEFVDASNAKTQFENNKMTGTNEYLAAVAKYVQAASKVKSAFESDALTDKGVNWINVSGTDVLQDADNVLDKFLKQNTSVMNKVQNMYSEKIGNIGNQIELLANPYDTLKSKLQEYAKLQDTLENNNRLSDDEEDEIWDKVDALEKYFVSLDKVGDKKKEIKQVLSDVALGSLFGDDAIQELSNVLGVKIPEAAKKAEDALKSIDNVDVADGSASVIKNDADDIIEDTKETVSAIDYAKKELTDAWKEYYKAARDAKNQGKDLTMQEPTDEMDRVEMSISKMLDKWGVTKGQKNTLMSIKEAIQYDEVDFDDIGDKVSNKFGMLEKIGAPVKVALEVVSTEANKLQNNMSDVGNEAQESSQEASIALDKIEDKTQDVVATFKDLVNYISQSGHGYNPSTFFDKLESGAHQVDEELSNILQSLKLIDSSGNINLESIKSGYTNAGGFVSDQYTMIARPDWYLPKIQSLQPMLMEAQQAGAKIGAIFDIIEDKANGLIYEVQNTVAGTAAFSHHNKSVNKNALGATDSQIKDLVNTLQVLQQKGLFVDWGGDNILYDKDQGFSIIDLGNKGGKSHTVSVQNTMQENLDRLVSEMFKFDKSIVQSSFVDSLYKMANDMGNNVVNPYSTTSNTSNKQHKAVQGSIDKTTASVKAEEDAHEQNTKAINAENAALQAQIELKKKAQSMKWEAFALDESTVDLKKQAGFQTLSDMEKFWKKANYEKKIDFSSMSKQAAEDIFYKNKVTSKLASDWYGSANFSAKNKLENEVLADDKLRNAALNYLYHIVIDKMSYKDDSFKNMSFEDFLDTEFTLYRGDDAPLIYGDQQKLSFSFDKDFASMWGALGQTQKIKPKNTIGNVGSSLESELEVFVPSDQTSWYKQTGETFLDFFNKQTKEVQDDINAGLINAEKQRISGILGDDFTKLTHQAGKESSFYKILQQFQQGVIPENLKVSGVGDTVDEFANAYNGLSDMGKKLAAYYASMDAISSSLPKQFSAVYGNKSASKNLIGQDANLFNAILNDPTGVKQHVAGLTGELGFNLFDKSAEEIKAETDAIEQHTKAIQSNTQAQQALNNVKSDYDSVEKMLFADTENAENMDQYKALSNLYNDLDLVHFTETQHASEISKGYFIDNNTGEALDISDIFDAIDKIEKRYGNNLDYVKDYLQQLYGKLDVGSTPQTSNDSASNVLNKLYHTDLGTGFDKAELVSKIIGGVNLIKDTPQHMLDNGTYTDTFTGATFNAFDLYDTIEDVEKQYGENLNYVKDYLDKVFAKWKADLDDLELEDDILPDEDDVLDIDEAFKTITGYDEVKKKIEDLSLININDSGKFIELMQIQDKLWAVQEDVKNDPGLIDKGKFLDVDTMQETDWSDLSNLISDFEAKYGENLDYIHDYLKDVFVKQHEELDELFIEFEDDDLIFDNNDTAKPAYSVKDYEDMYQLQDSSAQEAINDLARFQQEYDALQAKINSDPIDFMFGADKPTLEEQNEVLATFNALKAKMQEIQDMPLVETEDDKKKLQELQAEAVGLQNKLRSAKIDDFATGITYQETYGMSSVFEGIELRQFIDEGDVSSIVTELANKLEQKQQAVYDSVSQEFKDMIDNDSSDSLEQYFSQLSKQLQVQKEITSEKQKQASLDDVSVGGQVAVVKTEDVLQEVNAFNDLFVNVQEVKQAVEAKTQAFIDEGNVVDKVVQQEIDSLNKLKALLDEIQNTLQIIFAVNGQDLSNINIGQDKINGNTASGALQNIEQLLGQILGVLQGFTGIESDNKNSVKYKEPVIDSGMGTEEFANKLPENIATEDTLQAIRGTADEIVSLLKSKDVGSDNIDSIQKSLSILISALSANVKGLSDVASGIVQHQESQKMDTSAAVAKIADPVQHKQISDIAANSVGSLGSEVQIKNLKALADGLVRVEGAYKNADGAWEGFTVSINESNQAVDLAINKQSAFAKSLNDTSAELESQKIKDKAQLNTIAAQSKDLYKSLKIDPIDTSDAAVAVKDTYAELTKYIKEYQAKKESLTDEELNGLKQIQEQLLANAKLYAEQNGQSKKQNNATYGSNVMMTRTAQHNSLRSKISNDSLLSGSSVLTSAMQEYEASWNKLETLYNKIKNTPNPTEDDKVAFKEASAECNNLGKSVENLIKTYDKLHNDSNVVGSIKLENYDNRAKELRDYVEATYGAKAAIGDFRNNFNELEYTINNGDGTFTRAKVSIDNLRTSIIETAGDTQQVTSKFSQFTSAIGKKFSELWIYAASRFGVDEIIQQVRQGIEYVREIDTALTELKKVTNETDAVYNRFLQSMSKTAGVVGSTVSELTTMAAEWARLGYSIEESAKLAESTAILLNVSEFEDATAASEALISTMQAFQYTADESQHVVDILNEVGNNYAVSSDGIATALQDSASALMEGGNSFEQAAALVAAANRVVQDPNSVGSALRTISLRLRGTSVEVLEEMGEETDGVIESTSKLQEKIQALSGVNILTDSGDYKDTYTILKEIGQVWEDMSDIDQAALLELMAGKNRANTLSAILSNMEDLVGAYETAMNAEGSALRENKEYLDSIQGRIDLFNNSVQTMWMNTLDSDAVKFIVDFGRGIVELIDKVGLLRTAFVGVMTYLSASSKYDFDLASMLGIHDLKKGWTFGKEGLTGWIANLFSKNKSTIFDDLSNEAKKAEISVVGLNNELQTTDVIYEQLTMPGFETSNIQSATEAYQSMFSVLEKIQGVKLSIGDEQDAAKKIDAISSAAQNGQSALADYVSTLDDGDIALKAYITSVEDGNYSLAGFQQFVQQHNNSVKASGVAAKAAAVGHQLLNAAISMGISLLISGAISAITKWANANKEAAEAAREAADASKELREQNDSLEDYKKQIIELRKQLDSNTLSESDAYDARQKLLTIQDELIKKFGLEKDGINLVTGAINDQIAAIDTLSIKNAQQWLNNNQKSINEAIEYFDSDTQGGWLDAWYEMYDTAITNFAPTKNVRDMINEYADEHDHISTNNPLLTYSQDISFSGSVDEVKVTVEEFQNWLAGKEAEMQSELKNLTSLPEAEQTDDIKKKIDSLKADISQLQDVREDLGAEYENWFGEDSNYAANKDIIEETQYNTALVQYTDRYMKILQAQNDLVEAQAKGDQDGIKKALDTLNSETSAAATEAEANGQSYMISFFNGIRDEYAKQSNDINLEQDLSANIVFGDTKTNIQDYLAKALKDFDGKNSQEILQSYQINPDDAAFTELNAMAEAYGMTIEDLISSLVRLGYVQSGFDENSEVVVKSVLSYSDLVESVDTFKEVQDKTAEVITDNIEVTQEYKDSLIALGISEEDLSECFDENNDLVVKNAKALNKLVKEANKNVATNVKLAKSNARLEYYNLVKQLSNTLDGTKKLNAATRDSVYSTLEQIDAVEKALYQYQLLEDTLLGVNNAFDEFAEAQEIDALNTYGDSYVEMAQTMYDALYKTGQVGTEQFWAAAEALVPTEVYQHLTEDADRMKAIYDYYNKNILPSFRLEEDQLSLDYDAIEEFVKDGLDSGVFTGDVESFDLAEGMNLERAAELLGMTEAQVYALFAELDKYNTAGNEHSFLSQLDDSLEGRITNVTNDIEDLNKQKLALLEDGGYQKNKEAIDEINSKLAQSETELNKLGKEAYSTWQQYTQNDAVIAALNEVEDKTAFLTEEGARSLGLEWDEVKGQTVQQALDTLLAKQLTLGEPTVLTAQLAIDNIDSQIDALKQKLKESEEDPTVLGVKADADQATIDAAKQKIEEQIQALEEDMVVLSTTFGIELSEEQKATVQEELDAIEQFVINNKEFAVIVNGVSETNAALNSVKDTMDKIKDKTITLTTYDTTYQSKKLWNPKTKTWVYADANGTAHVDGTTYATGSWGAPKTETALVGELGPEMLVRNGRWMTVGDNGAEFTQVKKGDIIFNHKQTEDLLSKGYVTGRGKLHGGAFASGTAYSGLWNPTSPNASQSNAPGNDFSDVGNRLFDAADSISTAGDDLSDASDEFREVFDWIEVRLEEINEDISLRSAQLENKVGYKAQNKTVDQIIDLNQKLYDNLTAGAQKYYSYANKLLAEVPEEYHDAVQNGAIAIEEFVGEVDEKTLEAIQEYREWVQKGDEAAQKAEETLTEISNLAKQAIDNVATDYENKRSLRDNKIDQYEAYNEFLETDQGFESASIYQQMINENNDNIETLEEQRNKMQAELNKRVESGEIKKNSQDWYDAVNDIAAVDTEIIELKTDTENYQDAINELHWEHFDVLMGQYESISKEAENLIDILSNKDMVDESGNWTDEGIASLGLYAQQMENAEMQAKQYEEEIKYLNKNWQKLGYTEQEYLEKLDELKDGQYDAVQAYNDTKDAIVDLNKERIDAIKEGIEEEIEAYEELISKKKEELDAEKDLHDFQKNVMDQQKDIADIQRQLAALSGDNSASARAKRAQLEAELAEAQAQLDETYYERSISNQQEALDKELESFKEEKDKEKEALDEYLEDTEQVVSDSMGVVQANVDGISNTIGKTAKEYGLTINDALTKPWKDGAGAVSEYTEKFGDSISATSDALKELELDNLADQLETELSGSDAVDSVQDNFERYQAAEYQEPKKEESKEDSQKEEEKAIKVGGKINAGNAKIYDHVGAAAENQYYSKDPVYQVLAIDGNWVQVRHKSLKSGVTGWFKKSDVKAYAKGSKGINEDQWALIDELGDELLLRAHNGRLTYMEKGTGVVPEDLTSNLMEWGKLDPSMMLDQNRPRVGAHPEIHNTQVQIDNSIGELVHIDNCSTETLPDVKKIVNEALEKHTQRLNQSLRKYTR